MMRVPLLAFALLCACSGGDGPETTGPAAPSPFSWSLDIDLAGDASFHNLARDTSARGLVQGEISGRVNGFDSALARDTLYFSDWEYPDFKVRAPLTPDGSFRFDSYDLLGDLDGSHTLLIVLRAAHLRYRPVPETLRISLDRS
jgi:hypothetical protein